MSVGAGHRTGSEFAPLGPGDLAALEILADPAAALTEAKDVPADVQGAAVVIGQVPVGVDLVGLEPLPVPLNLDQLAAAGASDGGADEGGLDDRRVDDFGAVGGSAPVAPQEFAVFRGHSHQALIGQG